MPESVRKNNFHTLVDENKVYVCVHVCPKKIKALVLIEKSIIENAATNRFCTLRNNSQFGCL